MNVNELSIKEKVEWIVNKFDVFDEQKEFKRKRFTKLWIVDIIDDIRYDFCRLDEVKEFFHQHNIEISRNNISTYYIKYEKVIANKYRVYSN